MNWTDYFMGMAEYAATKSKDPSTKVGAVIVDGDRRIVSVGFNGFPKGVPDDVVDRDTKLRMTLHAEQNAILFARRDLTDCVLYVTHSPCARCAAMIVQSGICAVVAREPEPEFRGRWAADFADAKFMFEHAGVSLIHL